MKRYKDALCLRKEVEMKKKRIICISLMFILMSFFIPCGSLAETENNDLMNISFEADYGQTEARKMLGMINELRTGDDAWEYDENNQKVYHEDLGELEYNYELEAMAMQRAAEIALRFAHVRPNGEKWYSLSDIMSGENIAAGSSDAAETEEMLEERECLYDGQGHRRNILNKNFKSVGLGHVNFQGVDYWVQEFSYSGNVKDRTAPVDGKKEVETVILNSELKEKADISLSKAQLSLIVETKSDAPYLNFNFMFPETWPERTISLPLKSTWKSDDPEIAEIQGSQIAGIKVGKTVIRTSYKGKEFAVDVNVIPAGEWVSGGNRYQYADKHYAKGLCKIDGEIYYFDEEGYKQTGKQTINSAPYYFEDNGVAAEKGWIDADKEHIYYCYGDGKLATGKINLDGKHYRFDEEGNILRGKQKEGDRYYYYKSDGAEAESEWICNTQGDRLFYATGDGSLATEKTEIDGEYYRFDEEGNMLTGKQKEGDRYYYYKSDGTEVRSEWIYNSAKERLYYATGDGSLATGRINIEGSYYRFSGECKLLTGKVKVEDKYYFYDENGKEAKNEWVYISDKNQPYYATEDGSFATGRTEIEGNCYRFDEEGNMLTGKVKAENIHYYYHSDGTEAKSEWIYNSQGKKLYYATEDGSLATGRRNIEGSYYRFSSKGTIYRGRYKIGSHYYYYYKSSGREAGKGWIKGSDGKHLYYCKGSGRLVTGRVKISGHYYRFSSKATIYRGRYKIGSHYYYYYKSSGREAGKGWIKGSDGKHLYYCKGSGRLVTGRVKISGHYYRFSSKGNIYRGKHKIGKHYYYCYKSSGREAGKGWIKDSKGRKLYYCKGKGRLVTGKVKIKGHYYRFDSKGCLLKK